MPPASMRQIMDNRYWSEIIALHQRYLQTAAKVALRIVCERTQVATIPSCVPPCSVLHACGAKINVASVVQITDS